MTSSPNPNSRQRSVVICDVVIHYSDSDPSPTLAPWQRVAWAIILASMAGLVASFCHRVEDLPATALDRADALELSMEDTKR